MSELTSIQVSKETKDKLKALKQPKQTYEEVILHLLEVFCGRA
jgi:hypothetical protein